MDNYETTFKELVEWQPIETVPRDGTEVEIWSKYACHIGYASYKDTEKNKEKISDTVTHWRRKQVGPK